MKCERKKKWLNKLKKNWKKKKKLNEKLKDKQNANMMKLNIKDGKAITLKYYKNPKINSKQLIRKMIICKNLIKVY